MVAWRLNYQPPNLATRYWYYFTVALLQQNKFYNIGSNACQSACLPASLPLVTSLRWKYFVWLFKKKSFLVTRWLNSLLGQKYLSGGHLWSHWTTKSAKSCIFGHTWQCPLMHIYDHTGQNLPDFPFWVTLYKTYQISCFWSLWANSTRFCAFGHTLTN